MHLIVITCPTIMRSTAAKRLWMSCRCPLPEHRVGEVSRACRGHCMDAAGIRPASFGAVGGWPWKGLQQVKFALIMPVSEYGGGLLLLPFASRAACWHFAMRYGRRHAQALLCDTQGCRVLPHLPCRVPQSYVPFLELPFGQAKHAETGCPLAAGSCATWQRRPRRRFCAIFTHQCGQNSSALAQGAMSPDHLLRYGCRLLRELADKDPPAFLCHFYNIYFAHTAGGRMIGAKVASMILDSRELNFYKVWLGPARLSILKACHQKLVLPCPW